MERLRTLLPELISKGHRVLLFSQWTRLLDLLEVVLHTPLHLRPLGRRRLVLLYPCNSVCPIPTCGRRDSGGNLVRNVN